MAIDKDLDLLEKIWVMVKEWQDLYSGWKDGAFTDIKVGHRAGWNLMKITDSRMCDELLLLVVSVIL